MTNLNISLSEEIAAFINAQISEEGHASASDYLSALVREAQRRKEKEELDALLLEGLKNPLNPADIDWTEIRRQAEESLIGKNIRP